MKNTSYTVLVSVECQRSFLYLVLPFNVSTQPPSFYVQRSQFQTPLNRQIFNTLCLICWKIDCINCKNHLSVDLSKNAYYTYAIYFISSMILIPIFLVQETRDPPFSSHRNEISLSQPKSQKECDIHCCN